MSFPDNSGTSSGPPFYVLNLDPPFCISRCAVCRTVQALWLINNDDIVSARTSFTPFPRTQRRSVEPEIPPFPFRDVKDSGLFSFVFKVSSGFLRIQYYLLSFFPTIPSSAFW